MRVIIMQVCLFDNKIKQIINSVLNRLSLNKRGHMWNAMQADSAKHANSFHYLEMV